MDHDLRGRADQTFSQDLLGYESEPLLRKSGPSLPFDHLPRNVCADLRVTDPSIERDGELRS